MKKYLLLTAGATLSCSSGCSHMKEQPAGQGTVIPIDEVKIFSDNGNSIQGIATPGKGSAPRHVLMQCSG